MPIGLVSDDDLQRELSNLQTVHPKKVQIESRVEILDKRGRAVGDVNVPDSLRQIIGEESVINGRQSALELAKDFGVSPSSVSAYANGATSTKSYDSPTQSIISHINKSRQRNIKKASRVLSAAIEAITQDKLDYADATDLSGIAKDMSVIIKNLEPPNVVPSDNGVKSPQFVIFAPQFRDERSFEVIDVKE